MYSYLRLQPVKVISFDLDDTLYNNHPIIANAEEKLLHFLHLSYSESQRWQTDDWRKVKHQLMVEHPELRDDPSAARLAMLKQGLLQLGYSDMVAETAAQDGLALFLHYRSYFRVTDDVLDILAKLAQKYTLIGLTNGNVDWQQIGLSESFLFVHQAGQGLRMKPHRDMFELAISQLDIAPNELLHVGDNWNSDVQGARHVGCQAAWYNPDKHAKGEGQLPQLEISHLSELLQLL